jgi:hypothetical protein
MELAEVAAAVRQRKPELELLVRRAVDAELEQPLIPELRADRWVIRIDETQTSATRQRVTVLRSRG